jgi:iron complex outermembrane recepter protein
MAALAAAGQSATNTPAAMEKTIVEGIPLEETILPTARPVSSVMGDDRSILDTPRSVSLVTKAQLEDRAIATMTDLGQLAAGAYTPERYGLPGVPVIRGDLAEIYQNGQRMLYSRDSILPSFNQVEALDVVKGPGSAVYGPQGQGPGGYVNFVTKLPYFDSWHGEVSTRLGTWMPGGQSYLSPEATLDFGGPISKELAVRVSYLDREADSYYQNVKNRTHDIFAALTWRPSEKWQTDWTVQYIDARFNEITGINRVTQELLDHWTYNAGPVQALNAFGGPINSYGPPFGPGATFLLLNTNLLSKVRIYGSQALTSPGDVAQGEKLNSQLISTYTVSDSTKIVNLTYGEYLNSSKLESYGYTELVPENWVVNNRTEVHYDFNADIFKDDVAFKTISGLDFKYFRLKSYQDFSTEPFFLYDLTKPASTFSIPAIPTGSSVAGGYTVPGHPGYGYFEGAGNQDTDYYQTALFTQWSITPFKDFEIIPGGRADYFVVKSQSPDYIDYGGVYHGPGADFLAKKDRIDTSVFVSGVYKWTPSLSSYVTYDLVDSVAGSANFGGVNAVPSGSLSANQALKQSLTTPSELIEIGQKGSFFGNKLYAGVAAFQQTKSSPQLTGAPVKIQVRGIETEALYQPDRAFSVNANLTLQDAYVVNGDLYQQTGNYLDGYPVGFVQDGRQGTGAGSPNFNVTHYDKVHLAASPHVLFNAYLTYQFPCGFGLSFGPQVQGSQNQNYAPAQDQLKIQAQYVLNASVFYKQKTWEVRVNIDNLTDERNWTAIDPTFSGNDVVFPELPLHISGLIKIRF